MFEIKEENNLITFSTKIYYYDLNLGIIYKKGDEDNVNISFKIKDGSDGNIYYLGKVNENGLLSKKELYLNSSNNIVVNISNICYYNELIIEVYFSGSNIINKGNIKINILSRK